MKSTEPTIVELDIRELKEAFDRAQATLDPKDFALFKTMAESYLYFAEYIGSKNATIARLRKMIFGATTEKTAAVCGKKSDASDTPSANDAAATSAASGPAADAENSEKTPPKGHGCNGAAAYSGAEKVRVALESLQAGDACPSCGQGTVYASIPGIVMRIVGQSCVAILSGGLKSLQALGLSSKFATGGCRPGKRGPSLLRRWPHSSGGRVL